MTDKNTTIGIKEQTRKRLEALGKKGQSFDDVIVQMLEDCEGIEVCGGCSKRVNMRQTEQHVATDKGRRTVIVKECPVCGHQKFADKFKED